jgi:hypothetical protein
MPPDDASRPHPTTAPRSPGRGIFDRTDNCFLAAFQVIRDHLEALIYGPAALEFFAAEPALARFCLLEAAAATPTIAIRFREAVPMGVPALAEGRGELADQASLLPETEDAILGGIVSLATRSIIAGDTGKLPELLPDFIDFALGPYLGAERAAALADEARPSR